MMVVMKVILGEKDVVQYEEAKQDHLALEGNVVSSPSSPMMSMMMIVLQLRVIDSDSLVMLLVKGMIAYSW